MRRILALLWLPLALAADDWIELRSGPFQVLTSAGEREGREALGELEQFRHVFGTVLGKPDLQSVWPIRVVVFKSGRKAEPGSPLRLSRDAYVGSLAANAPAPVAWLRELGRIFLDANTGRLPADVEAGLLDFYSTIAIDGTRVTLGKPIAAPSPNWARIHMLSLHPAYHGKLRVLLSNLQQGAEPEPAYRNAFGKTPTEIEKEAAAYLAAGKFETEETSGRPLNVRRDFRPEPAAAGLPELTQADLNPSRAAYEKLPSSPEAREGLGLLAAGERNPEEARKQLAAAIEAGSRNARAYVEYARLEPDPAKAIAALRKAAELNPNWAEPHALIGARETDPARKAQALAAAAKLAPRNAALWQALAETQLALNDFRNSDRSWVAAERAAADDGERARVREARRGIEERRAEAEAATRRREADEKRREIERLKEAAMAEVRAAEARANRGAEPRETKAIPWFETPTAGGKVRGRLRQIDCLRGAARLVIEGEDGKLTRLLIRDPKKVVVFGGEELSLGCGPQRPLRMVAIEYFPKPDAKLASAGEVATLEYVK